MRHHPRHHHRKRVIAVFVAGPEWQFKGYPLVEQGGIVNLFQKGWFDGKHHQTRRSPLTRAALLLNSRVHSPWCACAL